ncbi:amidohydrolase family protein [Stenotrophomonas sp. CFBP8980]|uniref:amidohydrolase family protein n=1 Tax=Stenotrophomonas sp. CFBP8980 TaxID=3096523 RepID=UPI002A69F97C|nr:amidohydrolase family protein [Stenotrophomonas sp. CFBP8980]MDY1034586.1 amidohydrolase family protein [Stenotrophomonas sp. CFBP8980]
MRWNLRSWNGCAVVAMVVLAACTPEKTPPGEPSTTAKTEGQGGPSYAMADFSTVRKFDAHVHANDRGTALLEQARADNFGLLSINVDYPDFPSLLEQHAIAVAQARQDPGHFHWATTFSMKGYGSEGWAGQVNAALDRDVADGARAVKVWKNIGMVEKDAQGRAIMLEDPGLSPVAEHVRALDVPLIAHQGEPYNCWLPLDKMTTNNDREYFAKHPQYHMFLHPEQPSHAELMAVRDRFLAAHPQLRVVGAHMASLEYDVDVLAAFLDRFPQATVDLAARMSQVQYQSNADRTKVRDFFIRYQDRLLYGTDLTQSPGADPAQFKAETHAVWQSDWRYLATGESQRIEVLEADVAGLALPRAVIDKVYYGNAAREFKL